MTGSGSPNKMSWSARLLIALTLLLVGAGATAWAMANYPRLARTMGVNPPLKAEILPQRVVASPPPAAPPAPAAAPAADIERRLRNVELASQQAEGSAGRADGLVVAFAARRAIDRGVALGVLERLLVERFGDRHRAAVSTVITNARRPVRLSNLAARYEELGPTLRRGPKSEGWWAGVSRELGSLVQVHSADRPAQKPDARYDAARQALLLGDVDEALASTMRMPGAASANAWVADARRYVATQRALDELESAALLGPGRDGDRPR